MSYTVGDTQADWMPRYAHDQSLSVNEDGITRLMNDSITQSRRGVASRQRVRRRERGSPVGKAHANSRPNACYCFDQHRAVFGAYHDAAGNAVVPA